MKYIRIFFFSGLFFGVVATLINTYLLNDFYTGVMSGLVAGTTFGFLMATFTYFSDKQLQKKGINTKNTSPRQSRKIGSIPNE